MNAYQVTKEYVHALETANKASRKFRKAQMAYRARTIGDTEFLAAQALHNAAQKAFDVAFAKESELPE